VAPVATRAPALDERATADRLFEPGGVSLEDSILRIWDELVNEGRTACPVCGGSMTPAGGCEDCRSELS
jgi:hypothetical protein